MMVARVARRSREYSHAVRSIPRRAVAFSRGVFVCAPAPVLGQGIKLESLQGVTVTATLYYSDSFANMLGSAPGNIAHNYWIASGTALPRRPRTAMSRPPDIARSQTIVGQLFRKNPGVGAIEHRQFLMAPEQW
jgi:hypothetical protein